MKLPITPIRAKIATMLGLTTLLALALLIALSLGAMQIPFGTVLHCMVGGDINASENLASTVIEQIRLPRALAAVLVGAALAIAGAALQGLFRNPLADPGLLGVSSAAALAAVATIVLGATVLEDITIVFGIYTLPVAAFGGSLAATFALYYFAKHSGLMAVSTMLLLGIAFNAIAGAGIGLLTYMADDQQLRTLTFWSMGSLAGIGWDELKILAPLVVFATVLLLRESFKLNLFALGEFEARHLGVDSEKLIKTVMIWTSLLVGASVAVSGIIGFVGLVVPHLVRQLLGPDQRWLLPGSALVGALLLLIADTLARTIAAPAELPIGIITALIGGPFFLWMLVSAKGARL